MKSLSLMDFGASQDTRSQSILTRVRDKTLTFIPYSYVADIGIWTGMFLASFRTTRAAFGYGGVAAAALSPLLTYGLLRYVSIDDCSEDKYPD